MDAVVTSNLVLIPFVIALIALAVCTYSLVRMNQLVQRVEKFEENFQKIAVRLHKARKERKAAEEQTAYQRAQAMLAAGLNVNEVVRRCNISKPEAELLQLMRGQLQDIDDRKQG